MSVCSASPNLNRGAPVGSGLSPGTICPSSVSGWRPNSLLAGESPEPPGTMRSTATAFWRRLLPKEADVRLYSLHIAYSHFTLAVTKRAVGSCQHLGDPSLPQEFLELRADKGPALSETTVRHNPNRRNTRLNKFTAAAVVGPDVQSASIHPVPASTIAKNDRPSSSPLSKWRRSHGPAGARCRISSAAPELAFPDTGRNPAPTFQFRHPAPGTNSEGEHTTCLLYTSPSPRD